MASGQRVLAGGGGKVPHLHRRGLHKAVSRRQTELFAGMVLTGVQNLYNTFKDDWSELQDSLEQLRKERQAEQ